MSEFSDIVKQLSITPVIKDTVENTKPLSTTPVVAVGLVGQQIIVPAITFTAVGTYQVPQIVGQFNYTVPAQFRIINFGALVAKAASVSGCIICIRYRVGGTVFRYQLTGSPINTSIVPSIMYSGQLILPNFVIEIWQTTASTTFGIVNALTLTTSIIRNPLSSEDLQLDSLGYSTQVTLTNLQAAINPEALPTTYNTLGSWITN